MKYMNKQLASLTADNMLKTAKSKIEAKQNELNLYCEGIVLNSIPDKVYNLIKQLPDEWIEKSTSFYLNSPYGSSGGLYVKTTHEIPKKQYNQHNIEPTKAEYEHIKKLIDEIKSMKEKELQLRDQIIATLLKLRTLEKIKKDFPASVKHLPKDSMSGKNELSLPIEKILQSINDFPV